MKSFLTGLATGLAIGYLTAPGSGEATRQQLTDVASEQTKGLKEQWEKTTAQVTKLVDDVKSNSGLFKSEPNLFADIEAGKLDKYKDEAQLQKDRTINKYNKQVENTADAAQASVSKVEALKL